MAGSKISRRKLTKIGLVTLAVIVFGILLYYGFRMIYKADTGLTTVKNKGILTDSSNQPIGESNVLIQINDSPTP